MGLFSGFNADVNHLPTFNTGIPAGKYPARISKVTMEKDLYKNDPDQDFLVFEISVEGYEFPKTMNFTLPKTPAPWDGTTVVTIIEGSGRKLTEKDINENSLAKIRDFLTDCGIPLDKQDDVNPADLVDIRGVVTIAEQKKNPKYTNAVGFKVARNAGVSLPGQNNDVLSGTSIGTSPAASGSLWG